MGNDFINSTSRKAYALTRAVAAIYRTLGAEVDEDISLAGNRIDLLVNLGHTSEKVRYAVECKSYGKLVGLHTLRSFLSVIDLLKERGLVDKGVLISINGFTKEAHRLATDNNLDLIKLSELQQRLSGREQEVVRRVDTDFEHEDRLALTRGIRRGVFVVMPFEKPFDDVYILGIREVAEKLGLVVERADDIEHNI